MFSQQILIIQYHVKIFKQIAKLLAKTAEELNILLSLRYETIVSTNRFV